ncbi:peptidoglycan DD-metalloendopeptidase family protein [Pontibacter diazotrophicus]|uniref:peptidoglycan DD-metalloendopeptidase family protein n=1 Tax=Pontibacter diazotrophicus TaxID=1400979 RepID=UPI001FE88030|nr:peptidoglycan DD-metalloendopeptidase family protein [Pontibacter diazotrophicus]
MALLLAGCSGKQTLRGVFSKEQTPYEKYAAKLKDAKLDETALGQEWLQAGQQALRDSITVTLPFKETGYFSADKPKALGYRVTAKRGERLVVNLEMRAREQAQVFMDLFEAPAIPTEEPRRVASADTASTSLSYEVDEDQQHILRVQPELLRSGQYTVTIQAEPTLAFPVQGKTSRNIASIWGDPRDGGVRLHEGVDIFAKRGTPAIASAEGVVSKVSVTPRGGKVVWLTDVNRRQSLYYAHLDSQAVAAGQRVQMGDTLGFVGNTGNAITTNPHLHFGIYRFGRGATNPFPYLYESIQKVPDVKIDASLVGNWVRISAKSANIRLQPTTKSTVYTTLPQHTPLQVTGGVDTWYRIALPNGTEAYVAGSLVEATTKPVRYEKIAAETDLLDEAHPLAAAKDSLKPGSNVAVLGNYNGYRLVRNDAGLLGWINPEGNMSAR